jgi:hypothetical protein
MLPELIVMLTHNDKTVPDAVSIFEELKDSPVTYWGFKDIGLPRDEMVRLVDEMHTAGKKTCLEVVSLSEEEGLNGARIAVECGFSAVMGSVFFDSINEFLGGTNVEYYPFVGKVHGHPSILDGSIDEVVAQVRELQGKKVDGFDLLTYRYTGDPLRLLEEVVSAADGLPVVSAGSIDSFERIAEVRDAGAWGYTVGTAFFEKKFVKEGTFKDNMMAAWQWVQEHGR